MEHPLKSFLLKQLTVLSILEKFLEKKSATDLLFSIVMRVFNIHSVANDFLEISRKFPEQLFQRTKFLIWSDYFLKNSKIPFNPLRPGGNKRSHILKQTFN